MPGTQCWHGAPVYFYRSPHEFDAPDIVILVIPGNPGVPAFYAPVLELAVRRLRLLLSQEKSVANLKIEAVSLAYLGHSSSSHAENGTKGRLFGLQEQVEHHLAYILSRLKENPSIKLVIAGHSIGAYISLEILRRLCSILSVSNGSTSPDLSPAHSSPLSSVLRVVLLFPAIMNMAETPNGKSNRRLLPFRGVVASLATLLHVCVPTRVKDWIIAALARRKTCLTECESELFLEKEKSKTSDEEVRLSGEWSSAENADPAAAATSVSSSSSSSSSSSFSSTAPVNISPSSSSSSSSCSSEFDPFRERFLAHICEGIREVSNPHVLRNVLHLFSEELRHVRACDNELIQQHADKLVFYFGTTDGWAPMEHYHHVLSTCPGSCDSEEGEEPRASTVRLDKHGSEHAFMMRSCVEISEEIARMVHECVAGK